MNALLKRIILELIHLTGFSFFSRIVDMWNTLPLRLRQATIISSFKKGVREFLAGNVRGFYFYCYFSDWFFFVHISIRVFTFLIVCLI